MLLLCLKFWLPSKESFIVADSLKKKRETFLHLHVDMFSYFRYISFSLTGKHLEVGILQLTSERIVKA